MKDCHLIHLRAFSLVEVVIALGVISFALVALIGLIPMGLEGLSKAMSMSTQTRIMQNVASTLSQTTYANIPSSTNFYYDDQGNNVTSSSASNAVYETSVAFTNGITLPGGATNMELGTITVAISRIGQAHSVVTNSECIANLMP